MPTSNDVALTWIPAVSAALSFALAFAQSLGTFMIRGQSSEASIVIIMDGGPASRMTQSGMPTGWGRMCIVRGMSCHSKFVVPRQVAYFKTWPSELSLGMNQRCLVLRSRSLGGDFHSLFEASSTEWS